MGRTMLYGTQTGLSQLLDISDPFFQALDKNDEMIGVIVCKLEPHRGGPMRGYIAMLATREEYRGKGIASKLVRMAITKMIEMDADEVQRLSSRFSIQTLTIIRSLLRPRSTTYLRFASTKTSDSCVPSVCIATT